MLALFTCGPSSPQKYRRRSPDNVSVVSAGSMQRSMYSRALRSERPTLMTGETRSQDGGHAEVLRMPCVQ